MVPWNLNKIRKTGKWPEELKGLFPNSTGGPPVEVTYEKKATKAKTVRTYTLKSLSTSEVEGLARVLSGGKPGNPSLLKVEGPGGEDLTPLLMTAWGGVLPEVES
jgi:hypothetical protein